MHKDNQSLSVNVCVKMTRSDAMLIHEEAKRRGFETTGAFLRELLLGSLSVPTDRTLLLESAMRVEFLVAECFLVESFGATWTGNSKGQSVRTELVDVALFIPSVFMGMPDMQGILRHGNSLVMVQMPHLAKRKRCLAFVGRRDVPTFVTYVEPLAERLENDASQKPAAEIVDTETSARWKGPLQGPRAEA